MAWTSTDTKNYRRTVPGLLTLIYANQRMTSKKAGRELPAYTKQQLKDWMLSQPNFQLLWNNWVESDFQKELSPSVDRKNNTRSYTLDNIQLVTWKQNLLNQKHQQKTGIYICKVAKAVEQLTLDGVYIQTFASLQMAARSLGKKGSPSNITGACEGRFNKAYGYKWRFV